MDLFFLKVKGYLVVNNHHSSSQYSGHFPQCLSSKDVTSALKSVISEYTNIEEIISDNGKEFMTQEYQTYATTDGQLTTSSLYHPKRHGFIERQIHTINNILIKCDMDSTSPYIAGLGLRQDLWMTTYLLWLNLWEIQGTRQSSQHSL